MAFSVPCCLPLLVLQQLATFCVSELLPLYNLGNIGVYVYATKQIAITCTDIIQCGSEAYCKTQFCSSSQTINQSRFSTIGLYLYLYFYYIYKTRLNNFKVRKCFFFHLPVFVWLYSKNDDGLRAQANQLPLQCVSKVVWLTFDFDATTETFPTWMKDRCLEEQPCSQDSYSLQRFQCVSTVYLFLLQASVICFYCVKWVQNTSLCGHASTKASISPAHWRVWTELEYF